MSDFSRRRFVYGTGAAIAAGALAGCSGDGDDEGNGSDDGGEDGGENGGENGGGGLEDWLDEQDANEWDGELEDHTGEDEVQVEVGAGGGTAFSPPGITIDSGTTVLWEWTGQGGGHNVVSTDDSELEFGDDEVVDEEGHSIEETFDEAGEGRYVCEPHRAQGMAGGILVE